jgi:hypothetical protein
MLPRDHRASHSSYHAGLGINPEQAVRTFTQLKKDADDLCKAIADVEAALESSWAIQRVARRIATGQKGRPGTTGYVCSLLNHQVLVLEPNMTPPQLLPTYSY